VWFNDLMIYYIEHEIFKLLDDLDIIRTFTTKKSHVIYLLILFSTILADYVSYLLFQIVLLLTKWRVSSISIYDYLYIISHMNLRSKFCLGSTKFLAPPLVERKWIWKAWVWWWTSLDGCFSWIIWVRGGVWMWRGISWIWCVWVKEWRVRSNIIGWKGNKSWRVLRYQWKHQLLDS